MKKIPLQPIRPALRRPHIRSLYIATRLRLNVPVSDTAHFPSWIMLPSHLTL